MLERLGKFIVQERIGQGAMGEVYRGEDPALGREVALKTIRPDLAEGPELKARFQREARAAGLLNHPAIVTIYEFGEQDGLLFLAMEYVKGETLQDLLARGALGRGELLEVLAQVCDGLEHAHRHGIVHRDVKPANVMVSREDGRVAAKVMDFGVARLAGSNLTETGTVVGTVSYMAPEYLMDGHAGPASDQFAVGVMLWEGLTGRNPYTAETTGAVVYKIVHGTDPLARPEAAGLDPAVQRILRTVLCRDPLGRYPSAAGLAQALREARSGLASPDDEATTWLGGTPTARTRQAAPRRSWRLPALGIAAAVLAGLLAWHFLSARHPAPGGPGFASSNAVVLDEAAKFWEAKPADALRLAESVVAEEPANPRAWALKLACLYQLNRMVDFGGALQESEDHGVKRADLLAARPYRTVLERDKERRRLPEDLRKSLLNPA